MSTRRLAYVAGAVVALALILFSIYREDGTRELESAEVAVPPVEAEQSASAPAVPVVATEQGGRHVNAVRAEADQSVVAFAEWGRSFVAADEPGRAGMLVQGVALARRRAPEFLRLIQDDPKRALAERVPLLVRQELPPEILALIEERVNARGSVSTYMSAPIPGTEQPSAIRYAALADGAELQVHATGEEARTMINVKDRSLVGVAMPDENGKRHLALSTSRVEVLPVGYRVRAGKARKTVCPVSGNEVAGLAAEEDAVITEETPAVEANGEIVFLCDGSHTVLYDEQLLYAEGANGGPQGFPNFLPHGNPIALGVLRVLYIPMTFLDQNEAPASEATCYEVMRQVSEYYTAQSFGKLTVQTTVTPQVRLPHTEAWYIEKDAEVDGLGLEHSDARAAVRAMGYDTNGYDTIVVRLKGGPRATGGWGGGNSVWTYYDDAGIVAHEIGHTFGLAHANFWDTSGVSTIGSGASQEYGDSYDVMGGGGVPRGHYNIWAKQNLGWLLSEHLWTVSGSGTYRIYAHDANTLHPQRRYGLRVQKDAQRTYYVETRQLRDGQSGQQWLTNGAILEWRWSAEGGNNLLLDTTPGSPNGKQDGMLVIGKTWSDLEAGIHFTPVSVTPAGGGGQKAVDMVVNVGAFAGNTVPTLALNADALSVPVNRTVTFTATAGDADGDALAYFWDTSDGTIYGNAAVVQRTFASTGFYAMQCTVSDMKGGTATKTVIVTVGAPTRFNVSGTVTLGGQPMAGVTVGTGSKDVLTDVAGNYTIANLSAGAYTITPRVDGYTFTAAGVTVGPSAPGVNFSATEATLLSIAATVPATTEGSAVPGSFRLMRTGSTVGALTVRVQAVQGTAVASDYALLPAPSANTFAIPDGQASLDITVTPANDGSAEGPETVTLQIVPDPAYVVSGAAEATVVIEDDDTALPKAGVVVARPYTAEGAGEAAGFSVSRTGSTAGALTVHYTIGGSATNSADYAALSGSVTIPVGSVSAPVNVSAGADGANEGDETVTLTLANNAAYIVAGDASAATVAINDADLQSLTVTTSDPSAGETTSGTPNTATFVITRSGDFSASLTLYYGLAGTAQHGVDYEILPGSLTIPAGQSSGVITIVPTADGLGEGQETVILQLASLGSQYTLASSASSTATIADNPGDVPYVEVTTRDGLVGESDGTGRFRFTVTGGNGAAFNVAYTVGGTAVNGTDYSALSGTITIPAGSGTRTAEVTVTPTQDSAPEPLETIIVTISPSASYSTWTPAKSAMMWLRDDEQPTVFVDAHRDQPGESGAVSEFTISRVGSTVGALAVNYTMSGSATNGADYNLISGAASIPDGAASVDIAVTPTNDSDAEGTETIVMTLAPGSYSATPEAAVLYLADNETPSATVQFATTGAGGAEDAGTVNIPVTLSGVAGAAVEYSVSTGSSNSAVSKTATGDTAPYWVRVTRAGNTFSSFISPDGVTWSPQGVPQTIAISSASYTVGFAVCAFTNSALCTGVFDNVSVTGLDPGATQGAAVGVDIGTVGFPGSFGESGGTWTVNGSGADIYGTNDHFYTVRWTVTNSANCTMTARVLSVANTNAEAMAGVMFRDNSTATSARYAFTAVTPSSGMTQQYRPAVGAQNAGSFSSGFTLPYWVRLERTGSLLTAYRSADGLAWTQQSSVDLALSNPAQIGLAVCSHNDGTLATAVFDNVTVVGASGAEQPQDIGSVSANGSVSEAGGTYTVNGSGSDLEGTTDEFFYVARSLPGDGSITARVVSLSNTNTKAVAGVMIREDAVEKARHVSMLFRPSGTAEFIHRDGGISNATGSGADFELAAGVLTFSAGQTLANIPLTILDDSIREYGERLVIRLRNPTGASLGGISEFTYSITDNDGGLTQPLFVGFTSATDAGPESQASAPLLVALSSPSDQPVFVDYAVSGGSASTPTDYTLTSGTLTFLPGETAMRIPNTITDDAAPEPDRTITVSLTGPGGALLGEYAAHTYTITNDDGTPTVAITSPTTGNVNIPPGVGIALDATTGNMTGPISAVWSKVSGSGVVTFDGGSALARGATFSQPGTYVLRVVATAGELSAQAEVTVNVGVVNHYFAANHIGTVTIPAAGSFVDGVHTLSTTGAGIPSSGQPDNFDFFALPVNGDVSITARVVSVENVDGSSSRAGVMIRESLADSSAHVFMGITSESSGRFIRRTAIGGGSASTTASIPGLPYWVRLTRVGDNFSAAIAPDSGGAPGTFSAVGAVQTIPMSTLGFVGLAASSGDGSTPGDAVIDKVSITPGLANVGATVSAGVDQTVAVRSVNLAGGENDDGLPGAALVRTWSHVSGPGTVSFGSPTALATSAGINLGGAHTLRLTVDDGTVRAFDDTSITVNVTNPPIEIWRDAEFGANATNPAIGGDLADPDFDGMKNLLEYALDLDPNVPGLSGIVFDIETIGPSRYPRLTINRSPSATDVVFEVQVSSSVSTGWSGVGTIIENDTGALLRVRDGTAINGTPQRHLRLNVSRQP